MSKFVEGIKADRVKRLDNISCAYCCSKENLTKEHVIAKRFVPSGKLENQFNLFLNSCENCNNHKSKLEDDISAITMQPNLHGEYAHEDPVLRLEAGRKGKSKSKRTEKRVSESQEKLDINANDRGMSFNFKTVGPPQVDMERVYELAYYQIHSFFYLMTYNENLRLGQFWKGKFYEIIASIKGNWGSPLFISFAENIKDWNTKVFLTTADEFYKCHIKKHPDNDYWAWALEWNHNYRVTGCFGCEDTYKEFIKCLKPPESTKIPTQNDSYVILTEDIPINENEDTLFIEKWEKLP